MKKLICVLTIILLSMFLTGYSYSKKCPKCIEEAKANKQVMNDVGIAWRDFKEPIKHKDGKAYATYRCCYGHSFLVDLSE